MRITWRGEAGRAPVAQIGLAVVVAASLVAFSFFALRAGFGTVGAKGVKPVPPSQSAGVAITLPGPPAPRSAAAPTPTQPFLSTVAPRPLAPAPSLSPVAVPPARARGSLVASLTTTPVVSRPKQARGRFRGNFSQRYAHPNPAPAQSPEAKKHPKHPDTPNGKGENAGGSDETAPGTNPQGHPTPGHQKDGRGERVPPGQARKESEGGPDADSTESALPTPSPAGAPNRTGSRPNYAPDRHVPPGQAKKAGDWEPPGQAKKD